MSTIKETLELALEALEYIEHNYMSLPAPAEKAITALREALAEQPAQPQEPTKAMIDAAERIDWSDSDVRGNIINMWQAMCASIPQPAQQQGLVALDRDGMKKLLEQSGYATACPEEKAAFLSGVRHREAESLDAAPQPAQPQQEPVAVVSSVVNSGEKGVRVRWLGGFPQIGDRLYTSPQSKPWVGLTYEEAKEIYTCIHGYDSSKRIAEAIEAALRSKNT